MKTFIAFTLTFFLLTGYLTGQTTKTVGGSGADYGTLQLAFAAINNGSIQGQIILQITGNTTETARPYLNASATGLSNYASVLIYPTGNFTITTAGNWATIDLDGADNVSIDGRINQSGSIQSLTITGTNTGNGAAGIRFVNSAENNSVKYCNIKACSSNSSMGIVAFGGSNTGNGNDNNIVEYCDLTNSGVNRPYNGINSSGTSGRENNGCIIRYNNIYNNFQNGESSNGININNASVGFTIEGNSIYETTSFVATANALSYCAIRINTTNEHTISGNYIGGSGPSCSGTWSFTAYKAVYFCGIYTFAGNGTATSISNNTIANIDYSSKEDNPWDGIFLYSGNFDVSGNTFGATTGNGSITLTTPLPVATTTISGGAVTAINLLDGGSSYSTTPPIITFTAPPSGGTAPTATATVSGGKVTGFTLLTGGSGYTTAPAVIFDGQSNNYSTSHGMIQNSSGTVNITGNNIGSITTVGSDYYSHGFESVYVRTVTGSTTLSNNLIGSFTTLNSIHVSSSALYSFQKQDIYGLYSAGIGTTTISGNTVANLTNAYAGLNSGSRTRGINTIAGSNTITNNTVYNISSSSKQSTGGSAASTIGISQSSTTAGTTQTIDGNTIYNIKNTNPTDKSFVRGIYFYGPSSGSHTISGNFVHSLSIVSTDNNSDITGLELATGSFTCANNIVNIGGGISGGYIITGIWDESITTSVRNILFNTVYIGGTVASGGSITTALNNQINTATRDFRNNILFNARSGGSGKHYSLYIRNTGTTGLTCDYNDYYVSGTGGVMAYAGADKGTLALLQAATGGDTHSLNINPNFANAGGDFALDYYSSAVLPGVSGTGITTDYSGLTRPSPPKMGALESNNYVWQGGTSADFNIASNWQPAEVPPSGADITFAASPTHDCVLDQNRAVGNITNAQSTYKLITNGHQLTITKNLNLTNGAIVDASSASSVVIFAGASAQAIPTGAFFNNTVDGLTLNNSAGLTLNGNLTINQGLTLTSGTFTIGANTLTLNGAIAATSGTLTGGTSSNLIFGGSGASTTLQAITLSNLTINRPNGISLTGSVTVTGILTLTTGILTVDANTLTISGNSPTSAGGTIDASNASAGLVFSNASAIMLPSTFFTGAVNNLTISGSGGITSSSDFTLNGMLNLQSANPSATKGCLDMETNTLSMGSASTTTGSGDVTGIVKREHTFNVNTPYTFGSQFTTITFSDDETKPTWIELKIEIGNPPAWSSWTPEGKVSRYYNIACSSNASTAKAVVNMRYLVSELAASPYNDESKLVFWHKFTTFNGGSPHEHGKSNQNFDDHYIGVTGIILGAAATENINDSEIAMAYSLTTKNTWKGEVAGHQTEWEQGQNWTAGNVPLSTEDVLIPSGLAYYPSLTASSNAVAKSIQIEAGASISANAYNITISGYQGAWANNGNFYPGTGKVTFNHGISGEIVTISGITDFYNIEAGASTTMQPVAGCVLRIAGVGTANETSIVDFSTIDNTVEYNGAAQTIVNPFGLSGNSGYYNLKLSGSGIKTMPETAMNIQGNLTISGTASATASNDISIHGNLNIEEEATFGMGTFSHEVKGNISCNGTIVPASGSLFTMNGASPQAIDGVAESINLGDLTISNSSGVSLFTPAVTANLNIASGSLTVIAGVPLSVEGETNLNSAECLVLKSDAEGTASFIDNGTINGSGTALIERYLTPYDEVSDQKFHFISSPVSNSQAIEPEFINLSSNDITDFYKWDEPSNLWINFRGSTFNVRNEDFGDGFNFVAGKGYLVAYPNSVIKNFTGIPYTNPSGLAVNCTNTSGGGWNLLGNPFPSSINWNTVSKTNVDNSLYLYNNATAAYMYYNSLTGGTPGVTQYIPAEQGFMVHASAAGSITMKNSDREHQSLTTFYKNGDAYLTDNVLNIWVEGNGKRDYARVCFYGTATENFDGDYDAYKLFSYNSNPELYSLTPDNSLLAINTLPFSQMPGTVPVGFTPGRDGSFTFNAEGMENFTSGVDIVLKDLKLNTTQNLKENPVYTFSSSTSDDAKRFQLLFGVVGIGEQAGAKTVSGYYANGNLYITTNSGVTNVSIFNMQGQQLQNYQVNGTGQQSHPLNLPPGIYIARLTSSNTITSLKLLVK